jgi:hypothetical protein
MKIASVSLKVLILFVLIILTLPRSVVAVSPTVSQTLADNQKTIYELPDTGNILPNNPLFHIKRLRDETSLIFSKGNDKSRLLVTLSDRYTVYGQKMAKMNKPESAFALFGQSIAYQEELVSQLKKQNQANNIPTTTKDICYKAIQSNIKQAEVMRSILNDLSTTDQATLAKVLEKNIETRKLLEMCDK